MAKEIKVGIFSIIGIAILIIGYQFLKGINVFSASTQYFVTYEDVDFLSVSNPVMLHGMQVGMVQEIILHPDDPGKVLVKLNLSKDIKLPKQTSALIVSTGLMGGKAIKLVPNGRCSGTDCAQSGDYFKGRKQGMFEGMFGGSDGSPSNMINSQMGGFIDTLATHISDPNAQHAIAQSFHRIQGILSNLELTSQKLDRLMSLSSTKMSGTLGNFESISANLASNNQALNAIIANFNQFSQNLKSADIAGAVTLSKEMIAGSQNMIASLQTTVEESAKTFDQLNTLLEKVSQGDGSLAQLINDKQLYEQLQGVSKNLELLLQDFRLNPKRYVNVSVFGKKQKKYELPENDPAFDQNK